MRVASLDMYRKVPTDLAEGSKNGSRISLIATIAMIVLFALETRQFLENKIVADMQLDKSEKKQDSRFRINFNITMMDLKCELVTIDVVSFSGEDQNVSKNVNKYQVDANGVRQAFRGRNTAQFDILHHDESINESIEELHEDGQDAVSLTAETFKEVILQHKLVFVDYFAMWCSHCQKLMPTWESLAELMLSVAKASLLEEMPDLEHQEHFNEQTFQEASKLNVPVLIAKVDCVDNHSFCQKQHINAYPTLQLYIDGQPFKSEYWGDRTLPAFTHYLSNIEHEFEQKQNLIEKAHEQAKDALLKKGIEYEHILHRAHKSVNRKWKDEDHPGCQISGFLLLHRSPGNFHIQGRSNSHDIVPSMLNLSHIVHHLSFGEPFVQSIIHKQYPNTPLPSQLEQKLHPMDTNSYVIDHKHQAFHHHLKIITSKFPFQTQQLTAYRFLYQSHLSNYNEEEVPEAIFSYDLSPIAMSYRYQQQTFYSYLTSIFAIIGGTFTVAGLTERFIGFLYYTHRKTKVLRPLGQIIND